MLSDRPISEIAERALAERQRLPAAYAAHFDKILREDAALQSLLNPAWSWIEMELARLDARINAGKGRALCGVSLGVKDTIVVPGLPTRAGTPVDLGEILRLKPSVAVAALQEEGAVVVAKQATHQFGSSAGPAVTRSLRAPDYYAGGSTVGGAVAVAAGFTALALGTDGGGSLRKPAALAGVAGLRPKKGTICDEGEVNGALFGQSTGLIARSVADIAAVLKRCPRLLRAALEAERPGPLVIGVPDFARSAIAPSAEQALDAAASRLIHMGHVVVSVPLWIDETASRDFLIAVNFDNWTFHAPLLTARADIYAPAVARTMRLGEGITPQEAAAAKLRLADHRARFLEAAAARGVELLLTPSVPLPDTRICTASPQDLSGETGRFTILANIYDLDSLSLPLLREAEGTRSVMLTGLGISLATLLGCAHGLEVSHG
ncbi:amidase family protein [Ensifer canadensis]